MSVINEPEPAGGQSGAVGVTAPIGTTKWLNSDKFIVAPPAGGLGISRGGLVGTGYGRSGPKRFWQIVSSRISGLCVCVSVC